MVVVFLFACTCHRVCPWVRRIMRGRVCGGSKWPNENEGTKSWWWWKGAQFVRALRGPSLSCRSETAGDVPRSAYRGACTTVVM